MGTKRLASKHGLKVILEFGNPEEVYSMTSEAFSKVASNTKSRTEFVPKLWALVEDYEFDGLSLRWDKPGCPSVWKVHFDLNHHKIYLLHLYRASATSFIRMTRNISLSLSKSWILTIRCDKEANFLCSSLTANLCRSHMASTIQIYKAKLKLLNFLGFDLVSLANYVDYFYARSFNYNGVWSNTVQFDTPHIPFVSKFNSLSLRF